MEGLLIDTATGDLLITDGHLTIDNTDSQTAEHVVLAQRGEYKPYPLIGGEVRQHLGAPTTHDGFWKARLRRMLAWAGLNPRRIEMTADGISIE